ncbi:MAG TPA: hypothetical protein HPP83_07555 [Candidatus Hydrogenedentes bacterium]|nr:hypothetical protein [Candidatus Hydrogenedentota bacterium]
MAGRLGDEALAVSGPLELSGDDPPAQFSWGKPYANLCFDEVFHHSTGKAKCPVFSWYARCKLF